MASVAHVASHVASHFKLKVLTYCLFTLPRLSLAQPHFGDVGETRIVEGVPIYNYQRLREHGRLASGKSLRAGSHDWILMLHGHSANDEVREVCAGMPGCVGEGHPSKGGVAFVTVRMPEAGLRLLLRNHSAKVAFVEPDGPVQGALEVSPSKGFDASPSMSASKDPSKTPFIPWGLDRIDNRYNMDGSYNISMDGGDGVHVYLADTGILTTHTDFEGRAIPTLEVLGMNPRPCEASNVSCARDIYGHGTHCAGIVGGRKWGVAKKATLHAVKVLGDDNWGRYSWWIAALDWIAVHGERPAVISASLGGRGIPALAVAVDAVTRAGVPVIVSAGNENSDACAFMPSGIKSAITVGATGPDDHRASYSNFGSCVDIFAPGSHVLSDYATSDTAQSVMSGTSMACPHVAGAVALLLQSEPWLQPPEVLDRLTASATEGIVRGIIKGSPNLLLYVGVVGVEDRPPPEATCDEASWPDIDHHLRCGECKVLVKRFNMLYLTCDRYCKSLKRMCTGAWEDTLNTCDPLYQTACDQMIASTDAICKCGREAPGLD